jgi:UDP-N-acetylmuramoyl-L-alanyl-D-glutamate--2,6-diaminopimelate ligase
MQTLNAYPARGLKVIGVTGTNGKTSTCFLIQRMLHEAGYKVGLMTTVGYGVGADIKPQIQHMTTASSGLLLKRIKSMRAQGMEWLVLETTSHGLAQHRVWGIPFDIAVMTNVTHEHLDYHRTFERYRDAKRRLFKLANHNRKGLRAGVINAEDPSAKLFAADIAHPITYGIQQGDFRAEKISLKPNGVSYTAVYQDQQFQINCRLPGSFNVANSLAALCVGHLLGLSKSQIEQGIAALEGVEGRMTTIDEGQKFHVIVDFAHTPDSFEKLFTDLRPAVKGKLIALFGSAGRRDEAKRAVQGKLAGQYADEVVITEEDDRDIDGQEIMLQIASGAEDAGKVKDRNLFLVHNREEAISFAFSRAKPGDTVLLLGKGHEKTIERVDGAHPWNEIEVARKALKKFK